MICSRRRTSMSSRLVSTLMYDHNKYVHDPHSVFSCFSLRSVFPFRFFSGVHSMVRRGFRKTESLYYIIRHCSFFSPGNMFNVVNPARARTNIISRSTTTTAAAATAAAAWSYYDIYIITNWCAKSRSTND